MSADNGVYILRTLLPPIKNAGYSYTPRPGYEYRVAHCFAIDNIDYHDLYAVVYFGDSAIYYDEAEALHAAHQLANEVMRHGPLEYGVSVIVRDYYFPRMTVEAAKDALDVYDTAPESETPLGN